MSERKTYQYDVVLSFAGEQREYALQLAQKLRQLDLDVFYDRWETNELWGGNLSSLLASKYIEESLLCIVLFSKEYYAKPFTQMEFKYVMARREYDNSYVNPISMDGTVHKDWPENGAYIDSSKYSIDQIALSIRAKVITKKKELKLIDPEFHKESNKMTIFSDGEEEEVEVLLSFKYTDTNTEYLVYTKNEADELGNVTIYVASVEQDKGEPVLSSVKDEDWDRIKNTLQALAQDPDDDSSPFIKGEFHASDGLDLM